jgi:hypothetical protein
VSHRSSSVPTSVHSTGADAPLAQLDRAAYGDPNGHVLDFTKVPTDVLVARARAVWTHHPDFTG